MTQILTTARMAEIAKLAIRLQQISSCAAITSSGETVLHHTHVDEILSALHDVTAELRANREAQPVAWRYRTTDINGNPNPLWSFSEEASLMGLYQPLFTAPPAPAVPEKIGIQEAKELFNYLMTEEELNATVSGYNACRAAMLEQPVSGGYKLPPHAYRELVNSLRDTAVKYSGTDQLRERLNTVLSQFIEPDHPHKRTTEPDRN